jgi:hypothetical protein
MESRHFLNRLVPLFCLIKGSVTEDIMLQRSYNGGGNGRLFFFREG